MNWYKKAQDEGDDDLIQESIEDLLRDRNVPSRKQVIKEIKDQIGSQTGIQITDQWWNTYVEKYFRSVVPDLENTTTPDDMQNLIDKIVYAAEVCKGIGDWKWMEKMLVMDWDLFLAIVELVKMGPVRDSHDLGEALEAFESLCNKRDDIKGENPIDWADKIGARMVEMRAKYWEEADKWTQPHL